MKLLYINYEFPPIGGGGGRANAQIAKSMADKGHDVIVMTSAFKQLPQWEMRDGYLIYRIPTLRRYQEKCRIFEMLAFLFSSLFFGLRFARTWKPAFVISFFTIPSGPAAWLINKVLNIPYIISLRGGDVPGFMGKDLSFFHALAKPFIRMIWKSASSVVANSKGLQRLALRSAGNIPVKMIPNGVDSIFFADERSEEQSLSYLISRAFAGKKKPDTGTFKILSVGRLNVQKGLDHLLRAYASIKDQVAEADLWLVGHGPERDRLEKLAATLGIAEKVHFFGWLAPEEIKILYSTCDLFVLPSLDEGMPNALLEAMAVGLPCLGTKVAGTSDLICEGVNGLLVEPGNPVELSEALLKLVKQQNVLSQFAHASKEMAKAYPWDSVAQNYLNLCEV